ncbi:MAG: hypothetical protein ACYCUX_12550 [Metallibacterium sp.]
MVLPRYRGRSARSKPRAIVDGQTRAQAHVRILDQRAETEMMERHARAAFEAYWDLLRELLAAIRSAAAAAQSDPQ